MKINEREFFSQDLQPEDDSIYGTVKLRPWLIITEGLTSTNYLRELYILED